MGVKRRFLVFKWDFCRDFRGEEMIFTISRGFLGYKDEFWALQEDFGGFKGGFGGYFWGDFEV